MCQAESLQHQQQRTNRITVCMVSGYLYPLASGAGLQAITLAQRLRQRHIDVFFISQQLGNLPAYSLIKGFDVYRVVVKDTNTIISDFANWFYLGQILVTKKASFDIIHCHGLTFYEAICGLIGRVLHKPVIAKLTLTGTETNVGGRFTGYLHRRLLAYFHKFIPISRGLEKDLKGIGIDENRIEYIPNGVDINKFRKASMEEKSVLKMALNIFEKNVILFVGIIDRRKGIDHLIKVWENCRKKIPNSRLVIVGGETDKEDRWSDRHFFRQFQQMLRAINTDSISYVGRVDRVEEYMKIADVLVLPSKTEGLPNVLLEAMACSLPIVCTDIEGNRDVVVNGRNGYVFEYGDVGKLADVLTKVFEDENRMRYFGDESRRMVERHFSIELIADRYARLYAKLVRDRRND